VAQVSKPAELQELQTELARASFLALRGEDWVVAHRWFLQAGGLGFGSNDFDRADGSKGSVRSPRAVLELWPRLRAAMTDGDAGTWFSAELEITPHGRFDFTFNWDRRPWMNTRSEILAAPEPGAGPSDEDWLEDFRLHPRSPGRTPAWLAAIVAAGPRATPEVPAPEVDAARMEERFGALLAQPRWADLGAAVLRHTVEQLRLGGYVWSDPSDLPEGDPEVQRLVEEVVRRVIAEQLDPKRWGALLDLHAGAVAAGVMPPVAGSETIDREASGSAHHDPLEYRVWSALVETVARLIEALIDRD
jgi:hypothetical protein